LVLSGDLTEQLGDSGPWVDFGERALKGKSVAVRVFGLPE